MRANEFIVEDRKIALVGALMAALAAGPAAANEPSVAAQAIGILRTINNAKRMTADGLEAEARQELNQAIRAAGGHPDQSRVLGPIIKDLFRSSGPVPERPQEVINYNQMYKQ